jgi:hypothetical protein
MSKTLGTWLITSVLSAVLAIVAIERLDNVEESLLVSAAGADIHPGIDKVDIEFGRKTILLNVYLSKPLNCSQVITTLGIESLPIKDRVYFPDCKVVDHSLIKIVYTESITI